MILAVGNSFAQHATFNFREDLLTGKTLIHINIDSGEIDKVYKADAAIVGDAKRSVAALNKEIWPKAAAVPPRPAAGRDYDAERIVHLLDEIHPGQLAQAGLQAPAAEGIVLADAGAHLAWLGDYLELSPGQFFRKPGGFGPMAGHVYGAAGANVPIRSSRNALAAATDAYPLSGFGSF